MRFIVLMLLAVVTSDAAADWVKVGSSYAPGHGYQFAYVDPSTIHKSGGMVRMLDMFDYERSHDFFMPAGRALKYLSKKGQAEYDCKGKRWRQVKFSLYSGNMGKGNVVYASKAMPGKWQTAPPGTVFESRLILACGTK